MTFMAASIFVRTVDEVGDALERGREAVRAGVGMIEWRVDAVAEDEGGIAAVRSIVAESPAPCIITCRPTWEGGLHSGDDDNRLELFETILRAEQRPRYVDLELKSLRRNGEFRRLAERFAETAESARPTGVILSSHDFDHRPPDLLQRIEAMSEEPSCSVVKIAWTARSLRDNLEAFDLLAERRKPMIALCMGPFGLPSRVLAPKFGGLLTFATVGAGQETAPGQPTVRDLRRRYRFDSIDRDTHVYGVIGWPVEHSRGPDIHNAGFATVGHDGVYLPLPVPPEYEHFKATVGSLVDHPRLQFRGASVTLPHKQNLLRFVEERGGRIERLAERIGAANTLIVGSAGGLECANTDCPAVVDAVCSGARMKRAEFTGRKVAIIGAGGVARAAAVGFADAGANVIIFNRTQERARTLAGELSRRGVAGKVVPGKQGRIDCGCFDVIVNCTPVGMAGGPAPGDSPLLDDMPLDERSVVFDTVYTPERTPLIREAEARGARTITGVEMFLRQAGLQFERWTGQPAPLREFRGALAGPLIDEGAR